MRYDGIDLLRGLAAFGIVGCHLSLQDRTDAGCLVTALCDFNVGVFAAVAGFLMSGVKRPGELLGYVKKRAGRLLPSYVAWSVVFLLMTIVFDLVLDGGRVNPRYHTAQFWLSVVFQGGSATHLWFLICLFYAQVVMAWAFGVFNEAKHGVLWLLAGGALVYASVNLDNWYGIYPIRLLAFLVTGHGLGLLTRDRLESLRRYSPFLLFVAVAALVLHVCLRNPIPGFYRDWLVVGPVLLTFVALDFKSARLKRVAAFLGATSMGVYLVHPLFTRALSVVVAKCMPTPYTALVVLSEWLLAWLLSLAAAFLLSRLPVARRFV